MMAVANSTPGADSLRGVLDMLLQDMALEQIDGAALAWDRPMLVLRSAHMGRMKAFLDEIAGRTPVPMLHILSHGRDEAAIRAIARCDFTFHAYPTPGRYRLEEVPTALLEHLRGIEFDNVFFLDEGVAGDRLHEVQRLLSAVREERMVIFRGDGTFARSRDWRQRRVAEDAFFRLIEWYQLRLDPGFPDGPLLPDEPTK